MVRLFIFVGLVPVARNLFEDIAFFLIPECPFSKIPSVDVIELQDFFADF